MRLITREYSIALDCVFMNIVSVYCSRLCLHGHSVCANVSELGHLGNVYRKLSMSDHYIDH